MKISVMYLARGVDYGLEGLKKFLASYDKHPAGIEHDLVIVAKAWEDSAEYNSVCVLAQTKNARVINLPDDMLVFARASEMVDTELALYLVSSSEILCDDWLLKYYNAFMSDEKIQIVASAGSWGYWLSVPEFPNYHIRTVAFMMRTKWFLDYIKTQKIPVTKEDTYEAEHGVTSVTKFVLNQGCEAVVVNSEGEVFKHEDWPYSHTYQTQQPNKSIFTEKHLNIFKRANETDKMMMEFSNWGQSFKTTKIKIFIAYSKNAPLFFSEIFQPILTNFNGIKNRITLLRDNMRINISEKFPIYGDLTSHYWVLKNYLQRNENEYIGFCKHDTFLEFNLSQSIKKPFQSVPILEFEQIYKNFFNEGNIYNCIKDYDVILPEKIQLKNDTNANYILSLIRRHQPEYVNAAKNIISSKKIYSCLIFIMKKELVNEYLEWLFAIIGKYEETQEFSHIADLFFNIWLTTNIETKNLKVLNTSSVFIPMNLEPFKSH